MVILERLNEKNHDPVYVKTDVSLRQYYLARLELKLRNNDNFQYLMFILAAF